MECKPHACTGNMALGLAFLYTPSMPIASRSSRVRTRTWRSQAADLGPTFNGVLIGSTPHTARRARPTRPHRPHRNAKVPGCPDRTRRPAARLRTTGSPTPSGMRHRRRCDLRGHARRPRSLRCCFCNGAIHDGDDHHY